MGGRCILWSGLVAVLLWSSDLLAQDFKKGTLSGTVVSESVLVPAMTGSTVLTTPAEGFLVLTQACCGAAGTLAGNTFGTIPLGAAGECVTYTPGIALPQGETLTYTNAVDFEVTCMVTGVLTKK